MIGDNFDFWFLIFTGLVTGLCLGSFATMLSYRLPRHISVITPRSHCTACHHQLTPRELVPVFSWIAQKGRCANCGVSVSARYPLIEFATAALTAAAFATIGFAWLLPVALLVIVVGVTAVTMGIER